MCKSLNAVHATRLVLLLQRAAPPFPRWTSPPASSSCLKGCRSWWATIPRVHSCARASRSSSPVFTTPAPRPTSRRAPPPPMHAATRPCMIFLAAAPSSIVVPTNIILRHLRAAEGPGRGAGAGGAPAAGRTIRGAGRQCPGGGPAAGVLLVSALRLDRPPVLPAPRLPRLPPRPKVARGGAQARPPTGGGAGLGLRREQGIVCATHMRVCVFSSNACV